MNKIINFVKKETVLTVSGILALISMLIVPPSAAYIEYIGFRTLSLLLCLMTVMAGLSELGIFSALADALLRRVKTVRSIAVVLIMLCFFSSMLLTNDVALITFVPFAIETLGKAGHKKQIIPVVVMQTIAANLGSMLTPIGNPQNLYLFSLSGMEPGSFIMLMLPYTVLSFIVIAAACIYFPCKSAGYEPGERNIKPDNRKTAMYCVLFLLSLLTVAHILSFEAVLFITVISVLIADRRTLMKVDYSLIITFVFFFIFIGNMGKISAFKEFIQNIITGREVGVSILVSQCISNVPAAVLLSGFTDNLNAVIIGTDLGGLGTLIASMASLISFKYIVVYDNNIKGRYFVVFTIANIIMLAALILLYFVIT